MIPLIIWVYTFPMRGFGCFKNYPVFRILKFIEIPLHDRMLFKIFAPKTNDGIRKINHKKYLNKLAS